MDNGFVRKVFSAKGLSGNTARVWLCKNSAEFNDSAHLKEIASTGDYCATAFILVENETDNCYLVRWFSPFGEIQFCGHATFAAADVVAAKKTPLSAIKFISKKQKILVKVTKAGDYLMQVSKAILSRIEPASLPANLFNLPIINCQYTESKNGYLILELFNKSSVKNFDFEQKKYINYTDRALIVTAKETRSPLLYFRYFAPQYGIKEDTGTGSAAPLLAEYWQLPMGQLVQCIQLSRDGACFQVQRNTEHVTIVTKVTSP